MAEKKVKKVKETIEAKDIPETEPKLEDEGIQYKAEVKEYMEPKNEFSIKEMTIVDLMNYRKACTILRDYYGNSSRIASNAFEADEFNRKFNKYNSVLSKIMAEVSDRIDKLED